MLLLDPQQQPEGTCEIGSVPSILPSFLSSILFSFRLSRRFLGVVSLVFLKILAWCQKHYEVVPDSLIFWKIFFVPKIGKMSQKQGFLNLLKNMVINFYWICFIMKIYIICCVPGQIPYLEKFLFLKYGPKCSQPIRLQDFLINHISRTNH